MRARTSIEHRWMYNEEPVTARKGSDNLTYTGFTAWSYRTEIACKYPKQKVVLFNDNNYGPTTSRHQAHIRQAIPPDWAVVPVSPCTIRGKAFISDKLGLKETLGHMYDLAQEAANLAVNGKSRPARVKAYLDFMTKHNRYSALANFMKRKTRKIGRFIDLETIGRLNDELKAHEAWHEELRPAREAAQEKARATREAKRKAEQEARTEELREREKIRRLTPEERRARFYAHTLRRIDDDQPIALRLSRDGKCVETSRGVSISADAALKLYLFARHYVKCPLKRKKLLAAADGMDVGGYTLTSVDCDGNVTVGCHELAFTEMRKVFDEWVVRKD